MTETRKAAWKLGTFQNLCAQILWSAVMLHRFLKRVEQKRRTTVTGGSPGAKSSVPERVEKAAKKSPHSKRGAQIASRTALAMFLLVAWPTVVCAQADGGAALTAEQRANIRQVVNRGLDWLANSQLRSGRWHAEDGDYPTAMTALAVLALTSEGSTTMQGKYSRNIRRGVDFLLAQSRPNGLIGSSSDARYTYGHGYAMLALAQVLGEEEDLDRREHLTDVLVRAVAFTASAQTKAGGWGYVSAKDGGDFDEGSTTITQVQGLRACRNAGIPVPKETIDRAIAYIHRCTTPEGGVQYSIQGGPGRPAITAAAIACLYNAGDYDDDYVPKMLHFCRKNLENVESTSMGFWHYAHFYYAQVMYRQGGAEWEAYYRKIALKLVREARPTGGWKESYVGPVYTTANNLVILQLEQGNLPIFQR